MKIPLVNISGDPEQEEYGNVTLLKSKRIRIQDQFVIDTGSPKTVIPYDKAIRLQLSLNKKYPKTVYLGGNKYTAYEVKVTFSFYGKKGKKDKIAKEPLSCLVLKPTSPKKEKELGYFPIILGIDFLKKREYNLVMNFKKKEFYLEKY